VAPARSPSPKALGDVLTFRDEEGPEQQSESEASSSEEEERLSRLRGVIDGLGQLEAEHDERLASHSVGHVKVNGFGESRGQRRPRRAFSAPLPEAAGNVLSKVSHLSGNTVAVDDDDDGVMSGDGAWRRLAHRRRLADAFTLTDDPAISGAPANWLAPRRGITPPLQLRDVSVASVADEGERSLVSNDERWQLKPTASQRTDTAFKRTMPNEIWQRWEADLPAKIERADARNRRRLAAAAYRQRSLPVLVDDMAARWATIAAKAEEERPPSAELRRRLAKIEPSHLMLLAGKPLPLPLTTRPPSPSPLALKAVAAEQRRQQRAEEQDTREAARQKAAKEAAAEAERAQLTAEVLKSEHYMVEQAAAAARMKEKQEAEVAAKKAAANKAKVEASRARLSKKKEQMAAMEERLEVHRAAEAVEKEAVAKAEASRHAAARAKQEAPLRAAQLLAEQQAAARAAEETRIAAKQKAKVVALMQVGEKAAVTQIQAMFRRKVAKREVTVTRAATEQAQLEAQRQAEVEAVRLAAEEARLAAEQDVARAAAKKSRAMAEAAEKLRLQEEEAAAVAAAAEEKRLVAEQAAAEAELLRIQEMERVVLAEAVAEQERLANELQLAAEETAILEAEGKRDEADAELARLAAEEARAAEEAAEVVGAARSIQAMFCGNQDRQDLFAEKAAVTRVQGMFRRKSARRQVAAARVAAEEADMAVARLAAERRVAQEASTVEIARMSREKKENEMAIAQAAAGGDADAVRRLVMAGADPDALVPTPRGAAAGEPKATTPLLLAVQRDQMEVARRLLESGADPGLPSYNGSTPLMAAASNGMLKMLRLLLDTSTPRTRRWGLGELDVTNDAGWTAVHCGCHYGHLECAALLLGAGADGSIADHSGHTPLMGASAKGDAAAVKLLVEAGVNVNAKDEDGGTAFHYACWHGDVECTELLVTAGCDVEGADEDGQTGVHLAEAAGHTELVRRLGLGATAVAVAKLKAEEGQARLEEGSSSAESVLAARERCDSEYSEYSEYSETDLSETSEHDAEAVVDPARTIAAGKAGATLEL
jgi:ankyrin repeat protein